MEGIYFNIKKELVRLFRFYDDGEVLGFSISSSNFDSTHENLNWFNRENYNPLWGKGNYKLKSEHSSFVNSISISFELSTNQSTVLYSGHIKNSERIYICFCEESAKNKSDGERFHWNSNEEIEKLHFEKFHLDSDEENDLMRYQGHLGLMIRFEPRKLFDEYGQQYIIENGMEKHEKVGSIIQNSDAVKSYINHLRWTSSKPRPSDVHPLIESHSYFFLSKQETVCLGALWVISLWSNNGITKENDEIVTKIIAKMIDHCSKLKFNQFDSFFHRYFRRLRLMIH